MSQKARLGTTGIAGLAAVLALMTGCYKPNVESGLLRCATPPAKVCPDGFSCVGTVCVESSGSSGTGGRAGGSASGGRAGTGGRPGTGGQPGTGGGGNGGSGGVSGSGGATMPDAGQPPGIGQPCTIANRGQPDQSDDCESDAVCVDDCNQSVCYRVCSTDDNCPGSSCTRMTASGTMICEVAYTTCDPHAADGQQGCTGPTSCYLLSASAAPQGGERAVCDCTTGEGMVGDSCKDSRECFPRLLCLPASLPGGGACRPVCDPSNLLLNGCSFGVTCHAFGSKWGYCY